MTTDYISSNLVRLTKDTDTSIKDAQTNAAAKDGYEIISFPNNISSDRYPHYVNFYINANTKAKISSSDPLPNQTITDVNGNKVNITKANTANQRVLSDVEKVKAKIRNVGDDSSYQTVEDVTNFLDEFVASKKRLKRCISLYMPHSIQTNYSAQYNQIAPGGIMSTLFNDVFYGNDWKGNLTENVLQTLPGEVAVLLSGLGGAAIGGAFGNVAGGTLSATLIGAARSDDFTNAINRIRGAVTNQRQEQVFSHINFRSFQFDFVFAPRNQQDADTIKEIIKTFKLHMHPEVDESTGGNFLIMPDEFDIEFFYKGEQNKFINKIATCALANVSVNYTPMNVWSAVSKSDVPPLTTMSLTFVELEPITRQMIGQDY